MRILHTSDWHLGHAFCERSRAQEQDAFLDWLLETVDAKGVDAVVVAGDVFDTANPSAEALATYYRFLSRLAAIRGATRGGGRRVAVVVGGNHDSPARLDAPREVLSALDTHVVGGHEPARDGKLADPSGVLVPVRGAGGHVGLVVAAVPFLNDWRLGVRGFDVDAGEQLASMQAAFGGVYRRLADKAAAAFPGVPMLATGHLTCLGSAGARVGDEDAVPLEINRVGTLGAMGPGIFDPRYAYVALGHIHRGFAVDPAARVWYAGTPVQVSAVEAAEGRRVLLVDVDAGGARVEKLTVPCTRRLVPLTGTLDAVCEALGNLRVPVGELDPYVTVHATLDRPDTRAEAAVLAAAAANTGCRPVVVQVHARVARQGSGALDARPLFDDTALTPEEAFTFAWRARYGSEAAPPDPVLQRFRELVTRADGGAR